ncbi:MAG: hypothetical protein OXG55_07850 [bacterium]|nr:hypothetical protein [bacterium]
MTSEQAMLTICASAAVERVDQLLASWTRSHLVKNVAVSSPREMAKSGPKAACTYYDSGDENAISEMQLTEVLGRQPAGTRVTLAVFRDGADDHGDADERWRESIELEKSARRCLEDVLERRVVRKSITVGVYDYPCPVEAFSADWDQHLVHDRVVLQLPMRVLKLGTGDLSGLCAMMALSAGGSWAFSDGAVLNSTYDDQKQRARQWGAVRIVRPEIRIVTVGSLDAEIAEVTDRNFVEKPPWPLPCDEPVRSSSNDPFTSVPKEIALPKTSVSELVRTCGFDVDEIVEYRECNQFRLELRDALFSMNVATLVRMHLREWIAVSQEDISEAEAVVDAIDRFDHRVTNLEAAVAALRKANVADLELGRDVARRAREPWKKMREFFFSLVDGGDLPPGVSPLNPPVDARPDQMPVWSDPSALAPAPDRPLDPFDLVGLDRAIVDRLGVRCIHPLDVLHAPRLDSIITREEDPFPYLTDGLRPDLRGKIAPEIRDRWIEWRDTWWSTPLGELSNMLGSAIERAYGNFVESVKAIKQIKTDRYVVEQYSFNHRPFTACLLTFLSAAGLLAWRLLGNGGPVPESGSGFVGTVILCGVLLLLLHICYRRELKLIDQSELSSREFLDEVQRVQHHALEVARLHGLGRAFMDHQRVARVLLYEPFGIGGIEAETVTSSEDASKRFANLGPPSVLCGSSTLSDEQREALARLDRDDVYRRGWLTTAHTEMTESWKQAFSTLIGSEHFAMPDDDYLPPDEVPYQDSTEQRLPGPRQHFRESIERDAGLRTNGRLQIVKDLAQLARGAVQQVEELGSIKVERYPELSGLASDFVTFAGSELSSVEFDPSMLEFMEPVSVDESCSIGSVSAFRIQADGLSQPAFVSWRMLVSKACLAAGLRCVADENKRREDENSRRSFETQTSRQPTEVLQVPEI